MIIYGIQLKCEGNFKWQILKKAKLVQLDNMFMWFAKMHSQRTPVTGLTIIKKDKCFYDQIKITHKFTFSNSSNKNYM
jgi:hypothetical protein